jgi:hypothetical protein
LTFYLAKLSVGFICIIDGREENVTVHIATLSKTALTAIKSFIVGRESLSNSVTSQLSIPRKCQQRHVLKSEKKEKCNVDEPKKKAAILARAVCSKFQWSTIHANQE